jgi:hypothetical protein
MAQPFPSNRNAVQYIQGLRKRRLIREESLLRMPNACKGNRLHFHKLSQKVNE